MKIVNLDRNLIKIINANKKDCMIISYDTIIVLYRAKENKYYINDYMEQASNTTFRHFKNALGESYKDFIKHHKFELVSNKLFFNELFF
jgi:hypothetical protein